MKAANSSGRASHQKRAQESSTSTAVFIAGICTYIPTHTIPTHIYPTTEIKFCPMYIDRLPSLTSCIQDSQFNLNFCVAGRRLHEQRGGQKLGRNDGGGIGDVGVVDAGKDGPLVRDSHFVAVIPSNKLGSVPLRGTLQRVWTTGIACINARREAACKQYTDT